MKMRSLTRSLILICLTSCSPSKDIKREKVLPPKAIADELLDSRLASPRANKNYALLALPMSGRAESVGRSVLNACLMAADGSTGVNFYVVDTADASIDKFALRGRFRNPKAIIGPISSREAKSYGAMFPKSAVLSLSNDLKINGGGVFACGLSLQDEFQALAEYANAQGIDGFLIMLPEGALGDQILNAFVEELKKRGLEEGDDIEVIRYRGISRESATKYAKNSGKKAVFAINPILNTSELDGKTVFTTSSAALSNGEAWEGAVFAFADNDEQREFAKKYESAFGTRPTTLDMVGYDLAKSVKKSVDSSEPIVGNDYSGCLGEFSIDPKRGLRRSLQVFRMEDSQKAELTNENEPEAEESEG
jgi:ABC-type branched-subunit amino acid transport system substrate-binding protein